MRLREQKEGGEGKSVGYQSIGCRGSHVVRWLMLMCTQLKPKGPVVSSHTFTLNSCQLLMQEKENAAKTFKNPKLRCARAQQKK